MPKPFLLVLIIFVAGVLPGHVTAQMESENYRISTSVMSGGGGQSSSSSYQLNGTLGQSSPLMDPHNPPYSTSYDLYPGFWYTVGLDFECWFDHDGDGDVDGRDLARLADGFGTEYDETDLLSFAPEFGESFCP